MASVIDRSRKKNSESEERKARKLDNRFCSVLNVIIFSHLTYRSHILVIMDVWRLCVLQDREKGEGGEKENKDHEFTCVCGIMLNGASEARTYNRTGGYIGC